MTIGWIDNNYTYEEAIAESEEAKKHGIILLPSHYKEVFLDFDNDYQIWYGSRVSAKTYVKAIQYLYKCSSQNYFRGIFARQTAKDARDSQYQLFEDLIIRIYPFLQNEFFLETSKMRITCSHNNNFMKGASFENMPRSLAEYTDFWVDEPITRSGSITRSDLLDISGTLRNSYGVKTQKHLTFNPISNKTFIYTDFFENKLFKSNTLMCNYQHNVFCPPEKVEELEWYKDIDLERYLVDSLGMWGNPTNENPFINTFNRDKHIAKIPHTHDKRLYTYISVDFNVNPMTAIVLQTDLHITKIRIIDEFRALNSNVYELCDWIKENYNTKDIFITGDSSGNNRHAYSFNNLSGYQIIKNELMLNFSQIKVMKGKPAEYVQKKRLIGNAFFSKHTDITISNAPFLVEDIETIKVKPDGSMDKTNGLQSHLLDCLLDCLYVIARGNINNIR